MLSAPNATGDGLAQLIVDTYTGGKPLTLNESNVREQLTGQAYDGQYQGAEQRSWSGLNVPTHLAAKLKLNYQWVISKCVPPPPFCSDIPPTPTRHPTPSSDDT